MPTPLPRRNLTDLERLVQSLRVARAGAWLLRPDAQFTDFIRHRVLPLPAPRWRVMRADDLLVLDVSLYGLTLEASPAGDFLKRADPNAILFVHFPPQAIAEEAIDDSSPDDVPSPLPAGSLPVASRHAGPSRLAFRMPTGVENIAFTMQGILQAMAEWPLELAYTITAAPERSPGTVIRELTGQVARLLPPKVAARTTRIAERVGRRAAAAVDRAAASETIPDALDGLGQEVAAAAESLKLDAHQSSVLQVQAELAFAIQLVERDAPLVGIGGILDRLPGLFSFYTPRKPAENVTAIELPYRLIVSPDSGGAFSHSLSPVTHSGLTELWHTRLGERTGADVVDATETLSALAAIWSPDYDQPATNEPGFLTSLSDKDRDEIVRLTSDETGFMPGRPRRRYQPRPARARRLMLTSLGGWLDLDGHWTTTPANKQGKSLALTAWEHHAALGRDWFVKTVRIGRGLPLGHRMVLVVITERRFHDAPDGSGRVAVLRQRKYVEVIEPLRTYPHPAQHWSGRDFPFQTVEILTKRTPNLATTYDVGEDEDSFWPRVNEPGGATDFRFEIRAMDIGGNVVRFDVPLRYVSDEGDAPAAVNQYIAADQNVPGRTTAPLNAQAVQVAPAADRTDATGAPDPGDVVHPVKELRFGAYSVPAPPNGSQPPFHPAFRALRVFSTALAQLTGDNTPGEMVFADVYRTSGFDPAVNKAEILFAATAASGLKADFATRSSSDKAGGIVTPNFGVSGTSRALGLVGGDIDLLAGGTFDPAKFFPSAKIFGGIDLKDILAPVAVALVGATVPKLRTTRSRDKIETVFEHHVDDVPKSAPLLRMNERGKSKLDIKASLTAHFKVADPKVGPIGSGPGAIGGNPPGLDDPEAKAEAKLTWFKFNFFGCIIVSFDSFQFKVSAKDGVDADADIAKTDGVVFGGPLAFVDDLRRLLSGNKKSGAGGGAGGGGSSLPGFKATPIFKPSLKGLTVGVKLSLAEIPIGIFKMKNLMVSNALTLPFDGKPVSFQFSFAERSGPFQLVVAFYGGGGFVVVGLDCENGVKEIEAALEFGAYAEIDAGVASGAVYVKGGIYMYWYKPDKQTTLKGYVEMGGGVQVLGIVSVSILMHISLGYYKVGIASEVRGQATLVIEIEILFFSASVNLTVERRFAGASSDPTFADLLPSPAVWHAYADAYA